MIVGRRIQATVTMMQQLLLAAIALSVMVLTFIREVVILRQLRRKLLLSWMQRRASVAVGSCLQCSRRNHVFQRISWVTLVCRIPRLAAGYLLTQIGHGPQLRSSMEVITMGCPGWQEVILAAVGAPRMLWPCQRSITRVPMWRRMPAKPCRQRPMLQPSVRRHAVPSEPGLLTSQDVAAMKAPEATLYSSGVVVPQSCGETHGLFLMHLRVHCGPFLTGRLLHWSITLTAFVSMVAAQEHQFHAGPSQHALP
mmetsp:Transcript_104736/g.182053  ORF Transcript_104736/g.182053 Transcript_104736/m.182053 type:complete len:253 (+) Transcript_104736:266-1024(+)